MLTFVGAVDGEALGLEVVAVVVGVVVATAIEHPAVLLTSVETASDQMPEISC